MTAIAIVIGASGGIGRALVNQLAQQRPADTVYALSRQTGDAQGLPDNVVSVSIDTADEEAIKQFCAARKARHEQVVTAICTVGALHGEVGEVTLTPEKRLEDINQAQLQAYFAVNSIIPALWLKHLVSIMSASPSQVVCLSARVGSISDNRLGGWYGYRASKAALNMLIKTAAVEYARRAKATSLLCYHPGTVDTELSAPFQHNVKPEKLFTAQFTAERLLSALAALNSEQSPYFLDWDHQVVSW